MFARHRDIIGLDELNVIRTSKEMYAGLEKQAEKEYLDLARKRYQDYVQDSKDRTINSAWVSEKLSEYDPVTKYVFAHEVDRKRARMAEAIIAGVMAMQELLRARNLWLRQVKQYSINIEDAAVLEAFEVLGVKKVRWITNIDGHECKTCRERNGKVYPLAKVPPKPHYNCRCYFTPVGGWKDT